MALYQRCQTLELRIRKSQSGTGAFEHGSTGSSQTPFHRGPIEMEDGSDDSSPSLSPPSANVALSAIKGHVTSLTKSRGDLGLAFDVKATDADPYAAAPDPLKADLKTFDENLLYFVHGTNPADAKTYSDTFARAADSLQKQVGKL